jgi:class 3 adenylate cyclase
MNWLNKLSLGSKILFALLLTSLLSILLTGHIAYSGGRKGLTNAIFNGLTSLRSVQARAISDDFQRSENFVLTLSETRMTIDAIKEFKVAFAKLKEKSLSPSERQQLVGSYEKEFIPRLAKNLHGRGQPIVETYLPFRPEEQYLQYHYIAANSNPVGEKIKLNFAKDGSEYSDIHRKFHYRFRNILKRMGYYDMFLIDADTGQVLYTAAKEVDFVTNLKDGPFAGSNLAKAFTESVASRDPYSVSIVDFENYRASYGTPGAFITTTVYNGDKLIGVLILQLSSDHVNRVMTYGGKWSEVGLGKTGETYLVGEDKLLRTDPRLFLEDRSAYFQALERAKFDPEQIERIRNTNTPILSQKVDTEGVQKALSGESGESFYRDYRGVPVLGAYQPVKIGDFRWALVAKMDEAEAFKAVHDLTNRLLVTTAILIPLFTLFSIAIARLLARPINPLIAGTRKIMAGEKGVRVNVDSKDKIGTLAETFNAMAGSLDEKDRVIGQKIEENNKLLLNILPEPVAKRFQGGEQDIADSFPNVTVIYAEIVRFGDFSQDIPPDRTVGILNELIGAFDETAEQYGVEKLKTVGASYIAVCGLTIPRVDHAKRSVDFGFALLRLIEVFNQKQGANLDLSIGVHSGPVVAGIIGKTKFIYELWGDTMVIAKEIHDSAEPCVIQVSESVYSALQGLYDFTPVDDVKLKGKGYIRSWSIHPLHSVSSQSIGGKV